MFVKVTVYHLLKLTAIFRVKGLVSGLALNKKTHSYSHKRGKKTEENPLRQKNGYHKAVELKTTARYEIQNYEMPLESQAASKVLNNSSRINSDTCSR